jgi:hypothetical protein
VLLGLANLLFRCHAASIRLAENDVPEFLRMLDVASMVTFFVDPARLLLRQSRSLSKQPWRGATKWIFPVAGAVGQNGATIAKGPRAGHRISRAFLSETNGDGLPMLHPK